MSVPRISALAPVALAIAALLAAGRAFPQSEAGADAEPAAPAASVVAVAASVPAASQVAVSPAASAALAPVAPAVAPASTATEPAALPPAAPVNAPTGNATHAGDDVIRDAHDAFVRHDRAQLATLRATALTNRLPLAPWVDYWELTNRLTEATDDESSSSTPAGPAATSRTGCATTGCWRRGAATTGTRSGATTRASA